MLIFFSFLYLKYSLFSWEGRINWNLEAFENRGYGGKMSASDTAGPFHIFPIWKSDTLVQDRGHLAEETGGCMRKVGTLASTSVGHERGSYKQEAVSWLEQLSIQGSPAQSQNTEFYYNYIWNLYSLFIPQTANQIFIMLASQLSCKILPAGLFLEVNVTQWKSDEAKCTCRCHLSGCNCSVCKMG